MLIARNATVRIKVGQRYDILQGASVLLEGPERGYIVHPLHPVLRVCGVEHFDDESNEFQVPRFVCDEIDYWYDAEAE
jgi:hypothetical protein